MPNPYRQSRPASLCASPFRPTYNNFHPDMSQIHNSAVEKSVELPFNWFARMYAIAPVFSALGAVVNDCVAMVTRIAASLGEGRPGSDNQEADASDQRSHSEPLRPCLLARDLAQHALAKRIPLHWLTQPLARRSGHFLATAANSSGSKLSRHKVPPSHAPAGAVKVEPAKRRGRDL